MERFCKNFELLPESVKSRLTVENDDKASMYSTKELYHGVYKRIGVPIVFDYHHHRFCDGGLSEQEALELAISTWPSDIRPATHYSESRSKEQLDESIRPQAHSDYVYQKINTYGHDIDIMIEAKRKELGLLLNILNYMVNIIKNVIRLWMYKRHLKKRIEKNNFGRREEW